MAQKVKFTNPLIKGDTKTFKVTIKDADNVAVDITGHSLWFTMKVLKTDADVDAVVQVESVAPSNANSTNGIGFITLPSNVMEAVSAGKYNYDIQWVQQGSPPVVTTLIYGTLTVLEDITDST